MGGHRAVGQPPGGDEVVPFPAGYPAIDRRSGRGAVSDPCAAFATAGAAVAAATSGTTSPASGAGGGSGSVSAGAVAGPTVAGGPTTSGGSAAGFVVGSPAVCVAGWVVATAMGSVAAGDEWDE